MLTVEGLTFVGKTFYKSNDDAAIGLCDCF